MTSSSLNYDGFTNLFAANYLRLVGENGGTAVEYDRDGSGDANGFVRLVFLENVAPETLIADNFDPNFDPLGEASTPQTIEGTNASDNINGPSGDDIINGLSGSDQISGGFGNDTIDGGIGNDNLIGDGGNDTLIGGEGRDTLFGGNNDDILIGGNGDDRLVDGIGSNSFFGGAGNDTINVGGTSAIIDGGVGNDVIEIAIATQATITLGAGQDEIVLTQFSRTPNLVVTDFEAGATGDRIDFSAQLGPEFDGVSNPFGAGFARVIQDGSDAVLQIDRNGVDAPSLSYQDILRIQNVDADTLVAENFAPGLAIDGSGVSGQSIEGTNGADIITGSFGDDILNGLDGDDELFGGNGVDQIMGGIGDDILSGGFGRDILEGGDGNDSITGGGREDTLTGGSGADEFIFNAVTDGGDIITDFESGEDMFFINLAGFSLTDPASVLIDEVADSEDAAFLYDTSSGQLTFDADGNGAGSEELIADLSDGTLVLRSDFMFG